jgi:hypothetical protein
VPDEVSVVNDFLLRVASSLIGFALTAILGIGLYLWKRRDDVQREYVKQFVDSMLDFASRVLEDPTFFNYSKDEAETIRDHNIVYSFVARMNYLEFRINNKTIKTFCDSFGHNLVGYAERLASSNSMCRHHAGVHSEYHAAFSNLLTRWPYHFSLHVNERTWQVLPKVAFSPIGEELIWLEGQSE